MDEQKTIMQEYEENPKLDVIENKTEEIQQAFSQVAAEFAAETDKLATETPEELKAENLPPDQQMEFNSKFYKMYYKHFINLTSRLNKKALRRVVDRLVGYPLESPNEMKWGSKEEQNAFLIGNQLLEVKYLMFKYILQEQIQKAKDEEAKKKEVVANG